MSRLALLGGGLATPSGGGGDVTAPATSDLSFVETGQGVGTATITTDTNEGSFFGVFSDVATPGTGAQIASGLKSTGVAANHTFSQAPGGTGARTIAITGIPSTDALYVHVTQTDTAGNYATPLTYGPINITPALSAVVAKLSSTLTAQNLTSITTLAWNGGDVLDTDNAHDPASNNTRITVPSGWNYALFKGQVGITNITASDTVELTLKKNGIAITTYQLNSNRSGTGTTLMQQVIGHPDPVVAGDYFELQVTVQSDTSVDITSSQCWFSASKVG